MNREVDPLWEAEQAFEQAERQVRHLTSELEMAEAELVIARIKLGRARQAERENRGW